MGHDVFVSPLNVATAQASWAKENGVPLKIAPVLLSAIPGRVRDRVLVDVFERQVEHFAPDAIVNLNIYSIPSAVLARLRARDIWLVVQHAATPVPDELIALYDLALSSFPITLEHFRSRGIAAEYLRLAFEPALLNRLGPRPQQEGIVSFVGSFANAHSSRLAFFEELVGALPQLRIWAPSLPRGVSDPIREVYQGAAWGLEMYGVLHRSAVTINHHGDVPRYANNLRLFESTGVGTALLTDEKENLGGLFARGEEILTYTSVTDCAEAATDS